MAASRPQMTKTPLRDRATNSFVQLGLPAGLAAALAEAGVTEPFPIQSATLPDTLAGRDVLGRGRTGSGKTYAFVLPVLARLAGSPAPRRPGRPRALILAPTRELASQIHETLAPLAAALSLRSMTVFGGVGASPQIRQLRAGVDVLVACPGRLRDLVSDGAAALDAVEITVLDEADHMADLGFLPTVQWLMAKTPPRGQRLLFSATLDAAVDVLVRRFLTDPVTHGVDPVVAPVTTMTHHLLHVREDERLPVLVDLAAAPGRTLVFTRTKHGAKRLARHLNAAGVPAVELHGNLAQSARDRNLRAFSDGTASTLVATDIAARGIHVQGVALVVHADPPTEHKAYLHRSGRTGRAGADGTVITLVSDSQVADVGLLAHRAGISATVTRLRPGDPLLHRLAPGERTYEVTAQNQSSVETSAPARTSRTRAGRTRRGWAAAARSTSAERPGTGQSAHRHAADKHGTGGRTNRSHGTADTIARTDVPSSAATAPTTAGSAAAFSSKSRIGRRAR